ncbi:hypothetical protein ACIRD8_35135 [Streptomyces sp. NPDC102451]|uniref:hypothetical protein n=1 Tax=Streptomyces sp. NPDC102451 TaxID=3366177 RepID=UPI0037FC7E94
MSLGIVVSCDRPVPYGICAALLHTGARTEAEAYEVAARAGWAAGGAGTDLCPAHAPRRPRGGGPRCGNNPNFELSPGDQAAVAEFNAYLKRRAAGALAAAPHTP